MRVRRKSKTVNGEVEQSFTVTRKSGFGKVREELEFEITEKGWKQIFDSVRGEPIEKIRYTIEDDGFVIELDEYLNEELNGLLTVEVEFKSEEDSDKFIPPSWFGKEVTEDKNYKNQYLWVKVNY